MATLTARRSSFLACSTAPADDLLHSKGSAEYDVVVVVLTKQLHEDIVARSGVPVAGYGALLNPIYQKSPEGFVPTSTVV